MKDLQGNPLFNGSQNFLEQLLSNVINAYSFDDVKTIGFETFAQRIATLKIFPSDSPGEIIDFSLGKTPIEVLAKRLPNGLFQFPAAMAYALLGRIFYVDGTPRYLDEIPGEPRVFYDFEYGICFSEQVAYWLTANPPIGLFGLDAVTKLAAQLIERLDKENSSGAAWEAMGAQAFIREVAQKLIRDTGVTDLNDLDVRSEEQTQFVGTEGGVEEVPVTVYVLFDRTTGNVITVNPGAPWFDIGSWAQGEGATFATLHFDLNNKLVFRTFGKLTGLKAFLTSPLFKVAMLALAVYGITAALASISSAGLTIGNVAQLTASVDNLPGVDLGVIGDIASGVSTGLNLGSNIPEALTSGVDTMFDFPIDLDIGGLDTGGIDFDIPVMDVSDFDFNLTLEDIGANVVDLDLSIFEDFGLEATDLLPDDFGNIFTVTGEAVSLDPETYVKTIYIDEGGNFRDFSNEVVMSQAEADAAFNERGLDEDVANALAEKVRGLSGTSFVSTQGSANRPDGTPAPAAQGERPFFEVLSQEVLGWFKTITSYSLAKEQLQKTGRYTPPYQTNPNGTAYSQVPGVPIRRADGTVVTNNGNGTQTIQYPSGQVQTVPVSVNPAQISQGVYTPGSFGGSLIPGVSNQTLLIAGAGLVAVALLARRK
ncbi:MAG: hypothetical protein EBS53_14475 [Bacteroidetes bacterium]|nr:hypothetical protein [Bacteroidota bacterium]